MNANEYREEAAVRTAKQAAADALKQAAILKKRLALAGDELLATHSDLSSIADSLDPGAASTAEARMTEIRTTMHNIGRGEDIP